MKLQPKSKKCTGTKLDSNFRCPIQKESFKISKFKQEIYKEHLNWFNITLRMSCRRMSCSECLVYALNKNYHNAFYWNKNTRTVLFKKTYDTFKAYCCKLPVLLMLKIVWENNRSLCINCGRILKSCIYSFLLNLSR